MEVTSGGKYIALVSDAEGDNCFSICLVSE